MTRHEPGQAGVPFTRLSSRDQPSAWSRDLYYGGGLVLMAAVLALGLSVVRPTPRRRRLVVPAPVWARRDGRRRDR
jgi:hypothetical protein